MSNNYFIDKETIKEVGKALWVLRCEKKLKIYQVSEKTHIPIARIDLIELGLRFNFYDYRKLASFYGKNMRISFE